MEIYERIDMKHYEIVINDITFSVDAYSLAHALRKASNLRLEDTDIVRVRVKQ